MNLFHLLRPIAVLLVAVGSVTFSAHASAVERGYHLHGTAFLDAEGNITGAGNATHLGNYTEAGLASISGDNPFALDVQGAVTLTDFHGNEISETISGHLNWFTGEITATVTYVGGSGRFEGASGSASLVAQINPDDGSISVVVVGTIDY